ncbi:MAG: ABC transporter ATP-binding protein [Proteobacteria bacterium]|nr:ABC transporter ATP-binding protein [Pseudomonadota bacterium]MBU4470431.1 ABC transporter ATP-binding protein [Pseudomonadota bacterium]MCG2753484.1 ABC transporter ATP-binding protein [Desulfobacteraceae bacterium]
MSDTLVKVENVSKKFCRSLKKSLWYGMKDLGSELIGRSHGGNGELRTDEFWAVNDVSFELKRGECLGLIGRNGAGKTTLLRMLNGLIKPDKGCIEIRGRVGALIALGAGFNPILTGRENIYVNASILGLKKKEIDAKFDEIVEFAELGEFIDAPVQSYSSGMAVRLGFAVASSLRPDILLLDEVLAVGDVHFRSKCFQRIKAVQHNGGAILLVTHALEQVAHFCSRCILLEKGRLITDSDTPKTLEQYLSIIGRDSIKTVSSRAKRAKSPETIFDKVHFRANYNSNETRWGDYLATITDICLMQSELECDASITPGLQTELKFDVYFNSEIIEPIYGLTIKTTTGEIIFGTNSRQLVGFSEVSSQKKGDKVQICFGFIPYLDTGEYLISVGIASESKEGVKAHDRRYDSLKFRVAPPIEPTGEIAMAPTFRLTMPS